MRRGLVLVLALGLPSCGASSPAAPSAGAGVPLSGRYRLSVRPAAECAATPLPSTELDIQVGSSGDGAADLVGLSSPAFGTLTATGGTGSDLEARLEVYATDIPVSRLVADDGTLILYVFAQATGRVATGAGGRSEIPSGTLAGSVTYYRTTEGVSRTERCSVPGHGFSLIAR